MDYDEKSMSELIKNPELSSLKIKGEGYETLINSTCFIASLSDGKAHKLSQQIN